MFALSKTVTALRVSASIFSGLLAAGIQAAGNDNLQWLQAHHVVWTSQSKDASESMPCGGGYHGMNVWVENGELLCYVQRSGSLDENHEYLKLGRIRVRLDPNPFTPDASFRQELKLREGHVEITGEAGDQQVTVRVWSEVNRPLAHIEISADHPVSVSASYENWRMNDVSLPAMPSRQARFGCLSYDAYPGGVTRFRDVVAHQGDAVAFHHRNRDDKLLFDFAVRQQGLETVRNELVNTQKGRTFGGLLEGDGFVADGTGEGIYQITPFRSWRLKSTSPARKHHLRFISHVAQTDTLRQWQDQLAALRTATHPTLDEARRHALRWWADFWRRSHVVVSSLNPDENHKPWQIARNYQLFRYQLGCNLRGEFPTKFNGGDFTFDPSLAVKGRNFTPDWRAWGGGSFTAQNQRLLHWPMLKSGDADLLRPQFEFYRRALPSAIARVHHYWGHDGCLFTEHSETFGLPLACAWGWSEADAKARRRGAEIPFGDPRADASKGYDDVVEHGVQANGLISYHWESQVEFSYMMLEHHRFFGSDLRPYLPFIRQSVIFFDEHYQARERLRSGKPLDENGRLVIFPSTSCESYRGARNPTDLIAGLQACLESLLALDDDLVTEADKAYYRIYQKRLPDLPFGESGGERIIQPAESWERYANVECPQFYPLFPFNRFALGRDDMEVFRNSWKHGRFRKNLVQSWHQNGIFFARMGMAAEAADFNLRKLENSPRRFPTFWGPGHDWVPDHNWGGSGMIGLQEMLLQTIGDEILLFPAWPPEWDVDFKLHAPGNTVIECSYREGRIEMLVVTPKEREKDITIHRPPASPAGRDGN